jgi:outer membrane scaffolding protein for murein synthesis (MipA/OmpV family)
MRSIALLLSAGLISTQLYAEEPELNMALGSFDINKSGVAMGLVEYRFPASWSGFRPQAGLFFTEESGAYLYTGIGYPIYINEEWSLTPSLSAG